MIRRALFRCNGCEMQLHLLAPVERPCPACGGEFEEIEDEEEYAEFPVSNLPRKKQPRTLQPALIEQIIDDEMPEIISSFEEMLAKSSKDQGWG